MSQNDGVIISTESNEFILLLEIVFSFLIVALALIVIIMEFKRMSNKRRGDRSIANKATSSYAENPRSEQTNQGSN
jgi:hypothetical protein